GEDRAELCAKPEGHRGRNAPGAVVGDVATHDAAIFPHRIEADGNGVADLLVDVGGRAVERIAAPVGDANAGAALDEVLEHGSLGHQVHIAARSAASIVGGRTLEDLDGLDVERVAGVTARVAHAID